MFQKLTKLTTALALSTAVAVPAFAELSGTLRITSDMSNPAPRAVMEKMASDFDAMHPNLSVELTVVDREAWKTQIRNALSANAPDVVNWYAATRMTPYVDAGLFMDISDLWSEPEMAALASTKGAMTLDGKQWGVPYTYYQWGVYYRLQSSIQVVSVTPSAQSIFGLQAVGLTTSTHAQMAMTSTFSWPTAKLRGQMTVYARHLQTGVS